jgi:hypothetical protein
MALLLWAAHVYEPKSRDNVAACDAVQVLSLKLCHAFLSRTQVHWKPATLSSIKPTALTATDPTHNSFRLVIDFGRASPRDILLQLPQSAPRYSKRRMILAAPA